MGSPSSDIVDLIKHDHQELEDYYSKYKKAHQEGNHQEATKWFHEFLWEISRHSVSEEMVMYPMLDGIGAKGKQLAEKSRQDHQHVKQMLEKLMNLEDNPALFDQTMDTMMNDLRQHLRMEESEDLPLIREHVSAHDRESAGKKFQLGKKLAPTRPHSGVPNNKVAIEAALGLFMKPVDKLKDAFTPFPAT